MTQKPIIFRFWEDACDEYKENEGTLLPLWKFSFDKAEEMEVLLRITFNHLNDKIDHCIGPGQRE